MPPSASPPRIGSQRLPVWAGAACAAFCCWEGAAFAGACAGGAVTLRWAPTVRPPPIRRASASGTARTLPSRMIPSAINHFVMLHTSRPTMLSKTPAAMDRDHAGRKVENFDLVEAGFAQHRRERRLVGMQADRLGEVAVGVGVAGDLVAEPRQHLERVPVVGALERLPHLRELEDHDAAAGLEHARHLRERRVLARHVAQAEAHGDAIEVGRWKGHALAVALDARKAESFI